MHIHCPISAQIRLVITNHTPEFWYVVFINRWWYEENCTSKLPLEFYFYFKKNIVFNEVYLLFSLTVDRLVLTMEREVLANLHWCITHQGNFIHHHKHYIKFIIGISLSINPLHPKISVHILHIVSVQLLRCWQREFVYQSWEYSVGDHSLYSHNLTVWCRGYTVGRNYMLVTLGG